MLSEFDCYASISTDIGKLDLLNLQADFIAVDVAIGCIFIVAAHLEIIGAAFFEV